jgi:exonuclease III
MDPEKIFIWNVRGLNSVARHDSVRTFADTSRADIVCIQETEITTMTTRILLSALGSDFSEFLVVPSVGASGGSWWPGGDTSVSSAILELIIIV